MGLLTPPKYPERSDLENVATDFPPDVPRLGDKVRAVYVYGYDDIRVVESFVVSRALYHIHVAIEIHRQHGTNFDTFLMNKETRQWFYVHHFSGASFPASVKII